jgi:XTP/dITP diphosphohydrolase
MGAVNNKEKKVETFVRLMEIMEDLRAGCPWDMKQTWESLRHLTIEEVYELGDAILVNDAQEVKKELGDILLHLVFYAKIAEESEGFDLADALQHVCEKLIHRHPHIYGDVKVSDEEEVKANWERLKLKEGAKGVLAGVPKSLPAMVKAQRIQEKARGVGFDWDHPDQVWDKVKEELEEFHQACESEDDQAKMDELGDVLFSIINYARFVGLNPEEALERTNKKFIRRFQFMETKMHDQNLSWDQMKLMDLDVFWNQAKNEGL